MSRNMNPLYLGFGFIIPFIFVTVFSQTSQDEAIGYTLSVTSQGIVITEVYQNGILGTVVTTLHDFSTEIDNTTRWRIETQSLQLSPDRRRLAFFATEDDLTIIPFLFDITTRQISQLQVAMPYSENASSRMLWSPDSQRIYLDSLSPTVADPVVYDIDSQQILFSFSFDNPRFISPIWLSNSQDMLFVGGSTCPVACNSISDIYRVNVESGETQALTSLSPAILGIQNELNSRAIRVGVLAFDPNTRGAFFELTETLEDGPPLGVSYVASLQDDTTLSLDANIQSFYQDSLRTDILGLFLIESELYSITQMSGLGEVGVRWSIFRISSPNAPVVVYEKNFEGYIDFEVITSLAVSPDGKYIALGGSGGRTNTGSLQVINLSNGDIVQSIDGLTSVCNAHWTNNTDVIFSQSTVFRCNRRFVRFPSTSYVKLSINNGTTSEVVAESNDKVFFVSIYPQTPP